MSVTQIPFCCTRLYRSGLTYTIASVRENNSHEQDSNCEPVDHIDHTTGSKSPSFGGICGQWPQWLGDVLCSAQSSAQVVDVDIGCRIQAAQAVA